MSLKNLVKNINSNRQSLLIILCFAVVFWIFNTYRSSQATGKDTQSMHVINIALYKQKMDVVEAANYFKCFKETLQRALGKKWLVTITTCHSLKEGICKGISEGSIDIAGELSPIEYVDHYREYKFEPFLGMEYDERAFYHAVFFAPNDVVRCGMNLSSEPGKDNIGEIKDKLLEKGSSAYVAVDVEKSTSGYWYPLSYLISQGMPFKAKQEVKDHKVIYKKVLGKEAESNIYMGGFLADFRYENLRNEYKNNLDYHQPFIIDKSDPIPNGVFVISKEAIEKVGSDNMDELIRLWKTVRVPLGDPNDPNNPKLTGWRTGVKRDLDLVQKHKIKVKYNMEHGKYYPVYVSITISIFVILISLFAYIYLGKMA